MEKIAYLILNYKTWQDTINEANNIHDCLNADFRDILIVDNASPNESNERLSDFTNSVGARYIESKENKGYAAGNNIGLRYLWKCGYDFVWIMNNDIILSDEKMNTKALNIFRTESRAAAVSPDILNKDNAITNRDAKRPSFFDLTIGMIAYKKKGRTVLDLGGYGRVYRPQGCCMMLDLKKIKDVDFLDENTFLYCEESILAEKLILKGYDCFCMLNCTVFHNHSTTVKSSLVKRRILEINEKSFKYYLKEYRMFSNLKIKVCLIFNRIKMTMF